MRPDDRIELINGVGKTRAMQLNKLGIYTCRDLIYYFPKAYENRSEIKRLGDYSFDSSCSYILTVACEVTTTKVKGKMTISKFRTFDESGSVDVVFYNSPFVKDVFHVGKKFRFFGKISFSKYSRLNIINPKYEEIIPGVALEDYLPIYSLTEGLTYKTLDKIIRIAINDCLNDIEDPLPEKIRIKNELPTLATALKNIHYPESAEMLSRAKKRLAFDEMMMFALGISLSKKKRITTHGVRFDKVSLIPLISKLPYELTQAQKNAINDIYRDTVLKTANQDAPSMSRIIVGDVGSGKTVCAIAAIYIAVKSGYQAAFMVPTEILANQHFDELQKLLSNLDINVRLLTGSTSLKHKNNIYEEIKSGSADVVVGTHALITDKVNFKNLGLIVTDEQHRFGVAQRAVLKDKTSNAHMLVMSATPIPRTLALALYGDLDISRINEMPKGRTRVDTFVVDETYRSRINAFISKTVESGGQAYIVCPAIESSEDEEDGCNTDGISSREFVSNKSLNLKNTIEYTETLKKALPRIRIECLHGKMKSAEKDEIMHRFSIGEIDCLVSTTVIEVGVNVPNATLMIVENAERFGLSQLHQLRGRVGRGNKKSYCILVSDNKGEKSIARLDVMKTTYDGFEIADKDLLQRGPGDFFSSNPNISLRQSGGFEFKIANLCDDYSLYESAFSSAKGIVELDPELTLPEHSGIKKEVDRIIFHPSTIS